MSKTCGEQDRWGGSAGGIGGLVSVILDIVGGNEGYIEMVTLAEAKNYLRVDSDYEDGLIASMLRSAEATCADTARLSAEEWEAMSHYEPESSTVITIRGETLTTSDAQRLIELLRIAVLYTVGYLYEHREEADLHDLVLTLRNLLFAVREGVL